MPAPNLPSSFASAAAGQNANRDRGSGRGDSRGSGSGEWSRRDGRSNGTLTFRRSTATPFNPAATQSPAETPAQPPADSSENPTAAQLQPSIASTDLQPNRYSRDQLLELFKLQELGNIGVSALFASGWAPGQVNGSTARGWGKPGDSHPQQDPSACWDSSGTSAPIGLTEMSAEEKEMFAADVNSPVKQQQNKEAGQGVGLNGRKTSVSHGSNYGMSSPSTASRPGTRRRETTDTNPFPNAGLTSPTSAGRFPRDDPSSVWFGRKGPDAKEALADEAEEEAAALREAAASTAPFGGLSRANTSGSVSGFGASSLWGATGTPTASSAGGFGNFALPNPTIGDKRFGSTRGESRLAHLIPKDSAESVGAKGPEGPAADLARSWRARPRTDTDPFGADDGLSGSAVLGGARDTSPPPLPQQHHHQQQQQQGGHYAFDTPVKGGAGDFGMAGLSLGEGRTSASPSQTNPYRSPPADLRGDEEQHGVGSHSEQASNFGSIGRGFGPAAFDGSDRSQTSSVGAKAHPLGNLTGGWPAGPSTGTPDRDRPFANAFGSTLFSPMGDLQSPNMSGLGGMFGPATTGAIGTGSLRGSKLGSLFPAAMQAQMQSQDHESLSDSIPDVRQAHPLGAIGRGAIGSQVRDTSSPVRTGRSAFEDLFPTSESVRSPAFTAGEANPLAPAVAGQGHPFSPASSGQPFPAPQSGDVPPPQARTMVMPDRMRWVYLDPQGQMQGPFTGLEMNDWYKANFFTADLRVKKIEDPDFEPLGQLIRRIGNSREPFLVPQIGIPHGPPSQVGPFSPNDRGAGGGVIPPLMGVVPSFGRTLTAEEQNNLERRKQEEQYMMARQREFLAHQQAVVKMQMQTVGVPAALHHHSSAHSLQSQPSFGSITSPMGLPPQPAGQPPIGAIGATPGFFDQATPGGATQEPGTQGRTNAGAGSDAFRGEVLNAQERQMLSSLQGPGGISGMFPPQPVGAPPADNDVRSQLPGVDQLQTDSQGFSARLKEFQEIRAQRDAEEAQSDPSGLTGPTREEHEDAAASARAEAAEIISEVNRATAQEAKKTAEDAAQHAQAAAGAKQHAPQSSGLPMPFPPPSTTPLPAPAAQRKSNLPDQYSTRSRSETPDSTAAPVVAQPPPLAPWARDPAETQKGPSLKEIQEAEAKKAAKAEEAAAAARRAALEAEAAAAREREKAAATTVPALPTTSTWGNGSPVSVASANTGTASPWAKPGTVKAAPGLAGNTAAVAASKKTLADIQREEEVRKAKTRDVQHSASSTPAPSGGKRYADLASKTGAAVAAVAAAAAASPTATGPPPGSGWATVGAGGKVKIPTGPAAQTRAAIVSNVKPTAAPTPAPAPASRPPVKPAQPPAAPVDAGSAAMEGFNKWLHRELSRGISGGIDIESFASTLLVLPLDQQIISEAVYASSTTMDGRHFAEEFIRRKKLADKGVVEKQPTPVGDSKASAGAGGWSEVAKKGGSSSQPKEADAVGGTGFKVVPGRKKGKK